MGYVYNEIIERATTKYFLYLQEDWKFLKPIDVDALVNVMDDNPFIQQIWFAKFIQGNHWESLTGEILTLGDITLTEWQGQKKSSPSSWAFLPHIVRTDFIREAYRKAQCHVADRPEQVLKQWLVSQTKLQKNYNRISWILDNRQEYIQHLGIDGLHSKNLIAKRGKK